ncbi:NAD(P)/FAD-dependent oxidoreductase [Arcticibacter sp.]|uniref:NAD(P)/FAD-dependent oxidoreductase n=1 Tax=Arcticibacter sp. TaxID=1872630 RepID=UPI00388D673D
MKKERLYEAIIIGGSYAGLSAAMALGRSLRRVLVVDSGLPCNRQTPHSHNFLTQDGKTPGEIAKVARQQVEQYETVEFLNGIVTAGSKREEGFHIETESGLNFDAKKLIIAAGIKDHMPDIQGFSEAWGISVIHCPYCHGYEFRGKKTGILANGDKAVHLAGLVHNLTKDLTVFTNGRASLDSQQWQRLEKSKVSLIESGIVEIIHRNGQLSSLVLDDGQQVQLSALYAAIPFQQHSDIPQMLGCEMTENGHIRVDPMQKTSVPGVYACGDNSSPMRSIASAVNTGAIAGAMVNMELVNEAF